MKDEKKVEMKFWDELGRKIGKKEVMMMEGLVGLLFNYYYFYFF